NIPHLAFPLPFLLPVYDYLPISRFLLKTGLFFYDLLSFDKNELPHSEKFLPNHRWINKETAIKLEPRINTRGLKGAYLYYDVLDRHPERANMEYILSAHEKGAIISNYMEFMDLDLQKSVENHRNKKGSPVQICGVFALDKLTGEKIHIKGEVVINASGPWVDKTLSKTIKKPSKRILRSKGIHLLLPKINNDCALTFSTRDKRHFFLIPWLNYTLAGTTDSKFTGDLDNLRVTKSEATDFLNLIKSYYPVDISVSAIKHVYAGIRPLAVAKESKNTYNVSRKHEIIDHLITDNISGLYSVIGGKWTTSRALAEITVDKILKRQNKKFVKSVTEYMPLIGGRFEGSYENALSNAVKKMNGTMGFEFTEYLFSYYGIEYEKIIARFRKNPKSRKIIAKTFFLSIAQIEHAVEEESAVKLSDFLMRRSSIGNVGIPDLETLGEICEIMGKSLGWDNQRKESEIQEYLDTYRMVND
ncbi:MAG: glycerol-3-phosphate dehydrogenase/oxidase, partial [Spirochaetia bacterium]|nr:glycerol-3-phosphate dehydrogenase/oxidase [Spirochaetia bacterium]